MESLGKILSQVSQVTGPLEHFPILRKETRTCACGRKFVAHIKVIDGKDVLDGFDTCFACRATVREAKFREERLAKIPEARENQRWVWFDECNLPPKFCDKTFENFERKLQPGAFDVMLKYDYHFEVDPPCSLVLLSPDRYGVGKTHLAAALLNRIIEMEETVHVSKDGDFHNLPCPVYFTAENLLLSRIRQTYSRSNKYNDDECCEETEEDIYQKLEKYALLIIDDVGKVRPRDYSFLQGVYFRVIDFRYTHQHPIILTTNLSLAELENHIGGASSDRIREMAGKDGFIVMKGQSFRKR